MKFKKQTITALSSLFLLAALPIQPVSADSAAFTAATKNTTKISVSKVEYDLTDKTDSIELDFTSKIRMEDSSKVTVKDASGKTYKATISDYDKDDISISVPSLASNQKYTVTVSGIKKTTASKYGSLTVSFRVPKSSSLVKEVDYDSEDQEVSFDFGSNVTYKNAKAVITNASGTKTYTTSFVEKDKDEYTVRVKGLQVGKAYKYKLTGIKASGASSYQTISGSFTASAED